MDPERLLRVVQTKENNGDMPAGKRLVLEVNDGEDAMGRGRWRKEVLPSHLAPLLIEVADGALDRETARQMRELEPAPEPVVGVTEEVTPAVPRRAFDPSGQVDANEREIAKVIAAQDAAFNNLKGKK